MIILTISACILSRVYTLSTFLYATFNVRDSASPNLNYSVTVASVILGGEMELSNVFAVTRSSMAVMPRLINYNIAVYRPNSRVGLLERVYIGGVSAG